MDFLVFFFIKQKTAYEFRISDWSSDVFSSDLPEDAEARRTVELMRGKDVEIAIQRLHVHGQPRHRLASVEQDLRAHTVRHIRRAPYIKDRAQHVRHMRQRYDLVPGGQHRSHGVEIYFTEIGSAHV